MNADLIYAALLLAPGWPLLIALAMMIFPRWRIARLLAPVAALPALVLVVLEPSIGLHVPWLLLGTYFGLDIIGYYFLLFSSLLWLAAGLFASAYLAKDDLKSHFFVYFLLAMAGNFGLIIAQDVVSYYLFFALMSFASYGLVIHDRTVEALRAGRVYIVLVVVGEVLLFAAMILAAQTAENLTFAAVRAASAQSGVQDVVIMLALLGFGIKAGAIGLHMWLPLAHPVAPTPASAVLSGAMIKAGLLGWLRVLPLGEAMLPGWAGFIMAAGLAAAFYGVLVGVTQRNPKAVLAYSSISQMGVITVGVGLGLMLPQFWPLILMAVLVYALHHGLAKGALFLGVGVAAYTTSRFGRWSVGIGLLLPALALAGAPLTSGMLAKALLKEPLVFAPYPWDVWLKTILPWSAVATTLIMARFIYLTWPRKVDASAKAKPSGLVLPWMILLFATAVMAWLVPYNSGLKLWVDTAIIAALWPVAAGVIIALVIGVLAKRMLPMAVQVPPGDILVPLEKIISGLLHVGRSFGFQWLPAKWQAVVAMFDRISFRSIWLILGKGEFRLGQWAIAATLFVMLGIGIVAINLF